MNNFTIFTVQERSSGRNWPEVNVRCLTSGRKQNESDAHHAEDHRSIRDDLRIIMESYLHEADSLQISVDVMVDDGLHIPRGNTWSTYAFTQSGICRKANDRSWITRPSRDHISALIGS